MERRTSRAQVPNGRHRVDGSERGSSQTADVVGELLTIDEAAARMRMSGRYVRRLVAERRIPFYRFGRSVRLRSTDVDALVESGRVEPITAEDVRRHVFGVA